MLLNDILWNFIVKKDSSYFEKYLDFIKTTVQQDEERVKQEEAKISKVVTEKEEVTDENNFISVDDYLADLFGDHKQLEQIMYRSFVISIFAFIEAKIVDLCKHIKEERVQLFSYTDLSGARGIGQSVKYLEKVLMLDKFPINNKLYDEFNIAHKIRNYLVHEEGKIKSEDTIKIKITFEYAKSLIALNKNICNEISQNLKSH